jgi:hypothetical protein
MSPELDPAERVRLRVLQRLSDLGISKRELGLRMGGKKDAWAHDVLKGAIKFQLKDLDALAKALKMPVAALVKRDDDEAEFLAPSERRLLRAIRALPLAVRDHLIVLADYLVGVMPDEIELLTLYRTLTPEERQRLTHAAHVLRLSQDVEARKGRSADPPGEAPQGAAAPRRVQRQK